MGVLKGLTIANAGAARNLADMARGETPPDWMGFAKDLGKLTGSHTVLNLMSGGKNLESFLFKTHNWLIGGVHFDGIMRTEHTRRVRPTQYPVQTGVVMTDHAIVEPAELTIEIMMSDSHSTPFTANNPLLDGIYQAVQNNPLYANFAGKAERIGVGEGRAIRAWAVLRLMQESLQPLEVATRLKIYQNMLIEELSAPDDAKTVNALKATVRLREILTARVGETAVSKRVQLARQVDAGQIPVKSKGTDKTLSRAISDTIGGKKP